MDAVLTGTASAVQYVHRALADSEEGPSYTVNNIDAFSWMTWTGAILAFIMAFGIGANDVANTFGTSVGSKSLKIWQAAILASITEFLGCVLMGKNVTDTVRKGIVNPDAFADNPQVLMLGMFCALAGAGAWLLIATWLAMPVSTTHSIIGGILGFGVCYGDAVNWTKVGLVVMSWVASPVLAGIVGALLFVSVRWAVLRREDPLKAAYRFYPVFLFVMFLIMSLFVIIKGSPRYKLDNLIKDAEGKTDVGLSLMLAIGISLGVALVLTLITYFLLFRMCVQPRIEAYDEELAAKQLQRGYKDEATAQTVELSEVDEEAQARAINAPLPGTPNRPTNESEVTAVLIAEPLDDDNLQKQLEDETERNCLQQCWHTYLNPEEMDKKVHADIGGGAAEVNQLAEEFDPKTELLFNGVQVATAAFDSFAHGANDTANAIGPLAAIIGVGACGCAGGKQDIELWIVFYVAVALCIGLFVLGWRVIRSMGLKLVRVTPARGFTMELSSALTVIVASKLGIPVSTTHCQVGAEIGVGLLESGCGGGNTTKGVNWKLFGKVFLSWVFTLIFAGGVTAILFSFALYSPGMVGVTAVDITVTPASSGN